MIKATEARELASMSEAAINDEIKALDEAIRIAAEAGLTSLNVATDLNQKRVGLPSDMLTAPPIRPNRLGYDWRGGIYATVYEKPVLEKPTPPDKVLRVATILTQHGYRITWTIIHEWTDDGRHFGMMDEDPVNKYMVAYGLNIMW